MKALWQYLKHPQEHCSYDFSARAMLISALLCLLVPLLFKLLTATLFVVFGVDIPSLSSDKSILPLWFLIIFPPIVEELGFRLPLKRDRRSLYISVAFIAFVSSKLIFSGGLYTDHLLQRIIFAVITSVVINLTFGELLSNIKFEIFFYFTAILFAMLHIVNYTHLALSAIQWLYVICYAIAKLPGSILYGYARMKHGMLFCIVIHIINNLPALLL